MGQKLADRSRVIFALEFVLFAGWLYWMYQGGPGTTRGIAALLISVVAAHAAYDGSVLAVREYQRAQSGHVTMGVVVNKLSSTGADGSGRIRRPIARRSRRFVTTTGFTLHEEIARVILTGSLNAWVIEYRYACDAP